MDMNFRSTIIKYMLGNFTCQDVAQLMTDYLEGSLSFAERIRFQMHLGLCFACRNYLRQMKYTVATLRQLPADPIPPHVREELLKRFRTWKAHSPQSARKSEND